MSEEFEISRNTQGLVLLLSTVSGILLGMLGAYLHNRMKEPPQYDLLFGAATGMLIGVILQFVVLVALNQILS